MVDTEAFGKSRSDRYEQTAASLHKIRWGFTVLSAADLHRRASHNLGIVPATREDREVRRCPRSRSRHGDRSCWLHQYLLPNLSPGFQEASRCYCSFSSLAASAYSGSAQSLARPMRLQAQAAA